MGRVGLDQERIDYLSVRNQDFHGRRIFNAADGKDGQDYVTLNQLNSFQSQIEELSAQVLQLLNTQNVVPTIASNIVTYFQNDLVLTADTAIANTTTTPVPGMILNVRVTLNATAGWTITWGTQYVGVQTEIFNEATDFASFSFYGTADNKWQLLGLPVIRRGS